MAVFPFGYGGSPQGMGTLLTSDELDRKSTWARLHPEFRRRLHAMFEAAAAAGVPLGVGTGWRSYAEQAAAYARSPATFAPPGNSNHEGFGTADSDAVAIDSVPSTAWPWLEANAGRFGLRTFNQPSTWGYKGKDEPWHVQPVEIPASRSHRKARWDLPTFPLPDAPTAPHPSPTPTPTQPAPAPVTPPKEFDMTPPPTVARGSTGTSAKRAQGWLFATTGKPADIDGDFGPKSVDALIAFQKAHGLAADGVCGPNTWQALAKA